MRPGKQERGDVLDIEGVRHVPENEMGVVLLFAKLHPRLGFPAIDIIHPNFPDCWAFRRTEHGTKRVWIEFEYESSGFKEHTKTHRKMFRTLRPRRGLVVCWHHDWADCERYAEVIELRSVVGLGRRVWIQSTLPEYQGHLDDAPRRKRKEWSWSAPGKARPGDLVLMWRAGSVGDARRWKVDEDLLHSITNLYEVTSIPTKRPGESFGHGAHVRQVALIENPLRWEAIRADRILKDAWWVRATMQGRPDVTPYWWRLHQLLVDLNPTLKRNALFKTFAPGSI